MRYGPWKEVGTAAQRSVAPGITATYTWMYIMSTGLLPWLSLCVVVLQHVWSSASPAGLPSSITVWF
jgi:hypothetical protein